MIEQRVVFKCKHCKVTAHTIAVDGKRQHIECPRCERQMPWSKALKLARAFQLRQAQEMTKRTLKKAGMMGGSWKYKPAKITDVQGDFFLEAVD